MTNPTLVIGAGLGGLTAALALHRAGRPVMLLEASDAVGGRVRSDVVDGFVLDNGFQVLLDSYPTARQFLDLPGLQPRYFESGALLADRGDFFRLLHPIRHPAWFASSALTPAFSWSDKFALAGLVASCVIHSDSAILSRMESEADESTRQLLRRIGISEAMVRRFILPFFGGVFLDDSLETSAALFRYYLKKFAIGRALLPATGMGAIPAQLAGKLPASAIHLKTRAVALDIADGRVCGVLTESGERFAADALVLATDEPETCRLIGTPAAVPRAARGVTTVYLKSNQSLYTGSLLVLPASVPGRVITHLVQLSNIAPEYAPAPSHLISATILHPGELTDTELADRVVQEVGEIFTEGRGHLEPLAVVRTPYAQFNQSPGFLKKRPTPDLPANIFIAGDQTGSCSIESAITSGLHAAGEILKRPAPRS